MMNFLSIKKRNVFFIVAGLALTVIFFQNCAKTNLEQITQEKIVSTPTLDLKSDICSQARFLNGDSSKFVFIMDLSASNMGDWISETVGGQKLSYWDPSKATDPRGDRFEAIKNFLQNCAGPSDTKFAFIGFSRSAGVIGADNNLSCDGVTFGDKNLITSQITAIQNRQTADEAWYKRWIKPSYLTEQQPDSLIYSVTSYTAASKCLEKLIVTDLTENTGNTTDRYDIFFISDGVPQDKNGTGCNLSSYTAKQKTDCYLSENLGPIAMTRTAAISKSKKLRIQGIYYGNAGGVTPEVLEALSSEGGSEHVIQLANFQSKTALCDLVTTQNALDYRPDLYTIINMTVQRKGGILKADSDMDGLIDDEEAALGYDPQNPRSSGVSGILDSICARLGGTTACQAKRNLITCDPNVYDLLGMSECDHKILGLDRLPGVLDGIDSDRDGMPDFVEIVKGTDPAKADMFLDPDGDGVMNRDEILRGSDPFFSDRDLAAELLNRNQLNFKPSSRISTCESGDWELSVQNMLINKTLPVQDFPDSLAYLKHGRNEQMLLAVHRLTPTNSVAPIIEYYGIYVPVSVAGKAGSEVLTATPNRLVPSSFQFLGRASP